MLKLVKGCHKRTGLTETVLVISTSVCTNSTVSIGTLQGLQESVWFIQHFLLTVFVLIQCPLFGVSVNRDSTVLLTVAQQEDRFTEAIRHYRL